MIRYYRKISFFNVCETWFNYQFNVADIFRLNVFKHLKDVKRSIIPGVKVISYTVELNLEQDIESIFANFSSDIRRKTRKAESEGITCYFTTIPTALFPSSMILLRGKKHLPPVSKKWWNTVIMLK